MKTEWEKRVQLFSYSNVFIKRKISAFITWALDDILFAFPDFDLSQTNSKDPCPQARSFLLYHTGPGLMQCRPETGPVGTASPDDPLCCRSFSFHHISFNFDCFGVFFVCLKSLPPQESTWPLLGSGAVWSGILPLFGVLSVSTMQFFTRVLVHCRQQQWSLFFECNTQSPRRSSPHPISGHGIFYFLLKLRLYVIWANPSIDNRLFPLTLLLLVLWRDFVLSLFVPRDVHHLTLPG